MKEAQRTEKSGTSEVGPTEERVRVLVVDDDDVLRGTIQRVLRARGLDVEGAESGAVALARLAEATFDVVLADVRMPAMSGPEFLRQLRAARRDVEVVLMTAFADASTRRAVFESGAFALLSKPFISNDAVVQEIQNAAAHRRRTRSD